MSKRTWKRKALTDDRIREALKASGGNGAAAAAELGVHRSTMSRWIRDDPSLAPESATREVPAAIVASENMDPAQWKRWVLATYDLNATELQLLSLAVEALEMARDRLFKPAERMAAAARFQSIVKQLSFPDPEVADESEESETARPQLELVK